MGIDISADEARKIARKANNIQLALAQANAIVRSAADGGNYMTFWAITPFSPDIVSQVINSLVAKGFVVERDSQQVRIRWPDPVAAAALANDALTS